MTASVIQRRSVPSHVNVVGGTQDGGDTNSCTSFDDDSSTGSGSSFRFGLRVWDRVTSSIRAIDTSSQSNCSQANGISNNNNNNNNADTQPEVENRRRRLEKEEKERQRRYEQFKRDEAVVMEVMNKKLEQEQRALSRKRVVKEKKQQLAKQSASRRNHKRQDNILMFLEKDNHLPVSSPRKTNKNNSNKNRSMMNKDNEDFDTNNINPEMNQDSGRSNGSNDTEETVPEDGIGATTSEEDDYDYDGYTKTIRWCSSVDTELARRQIHRQTKPTRPGGLAKRVRRLHHHKSSAVETFHEEGMYVEAEGDDDDELQEEAVEVITEDMKIKVFHLEEEEEDTESIGSF